MKDEEEGRGGPDLQFFSNTKSSSEKDPFFGLNQPRLPNWQSLGLGEAFVAHLYGEPSFRSSFVRCVSHVEMRTLHRTEGQVVAVADLLLRSDRQKRQQSPNAWHSYKAQAYEIVCDSFVGIKVV